MLILTRKPGEAIVINGDIRVRVLSIEGERVKLGVDAPREVPVLRQELLDEVRQSNLEAVTRGESPEQVVASLQEALQRRRG
ncbi:MAG: carbon storage regulator CsrA [Anaerolineae bacterium]